MNKQRKEFKFEIDLTSNNIAGSTDESNDDISIRVLTSIQEAMHSLSSNSWIDEFIINVNNLNISNAYDLFEKNKSRLQYISEKSVLIQLRLLNVSLLDKKQKKEFLTYLIVSAGILNQRDELLEKEIDLLFSEFKDELEIELILNLELEKANISASNKLYYQAVSRYKKLLEQKEIETSIKAWAYQGLSLIANNDEDFIFYTNLAIDTFLETGNKEVAISNIVSLADFESKTDVKKALERLDYAIKIMGDSSLLDKEYSASLKHRKAQFLYIRNNLKEALIVTEEACILRRGLFGSEVALHASLSLASIITQRLNYDDKRQIYNNELLKVSRLIKDDNFSLRQALASCVQEKIKIPKELTEKAVNNNDSYTICAIYIYEYSLVTNEDDESIGLIDNAIMLAEELKDDALLSDIYMAIADRNNNNNQFKDAFIAYKKSLDYNSLNSASYQNCISMLFKNKLYIEAEDFLKKQIEIIGELPNICFYYAKSLYENKNYSLSLQYFKKSNHSSTEIDTYMLACLKNMDNNELLDIKQNEKNIHITKDNFEKSLYEFSKSISQHSRMHFWKYNKEVNKYKWTEKPEELSKQLLINFLNGKFGEDSIEIIQEPRAGAGFIDLYLLLKGGLKVIVELKMCGTGYSSTYAISGESQIIHYAKNKNTHIGFLVIFDSRVRDYGKLFMDIQTLENIIIHTIAIDVRSEIKTKHL
jgi:tetratricopeptide (TPR) repeat protein